MSIIKLKKGFDLKLKGTVDANTLPSATIESKLCAVVPDDFHGITPRLDKKEGESVQAGEAIYHDKVYESVKVTSPVSGTIKEIRRGERRKIECIVIENDNQGNTMVHDLKQPVKDTLLASGLWVMMRQRPYDVVPNPDVAPRDIFVTAFDSAPQAISLMAVAQTEYAAKGVEVLKSLTEGNVHVSFAPGQEMELPGAECHTVQGPHPAGNAGVQAANIAPVNKGETVWTLDFVTLCRIGQLFTTGKVSYTTSVAVVGECIDTPVVVETTMGCSIGDVLNGRVSAELDACRVISGNVLTGSKTDCEGWLRAPYRQVTVIPEISKKDEFMGWASLNPNRYSIYRLFTTWLAGKRGKEASMDARLKGGERAIVCAGEYDRMLPMDIYAEFLIKAIIAFDIDKMEQLGIYEVAPEDFALAEYADTSKLELQRLVREGLDRMRAEMC
uniref:Na(+)-translocating NADH-quinone reductase subunit A n=1 Tax=uncultured bacterium fosmid pJB71G8 TaxID=1478068 RepID=A0A0H3U800_9BACT|nr:putative Na(+)-translocating reductase subunit A [uncultured bacterium fosmid pJB71G8]